MRLQQGARLALGLFLLAAACGPSESELTGGHLAEDPRSPGLVQLDSALGTLDRHNLMSDADLTGGSTVTVAQVQGFLTAKGSYLAHYSDPAWGKSAATLVVERSRAYGINPVYMLARIEAESGLVRSGTSNNLAQATGCACPDSGSCDGSWAGFGNQVECSAAKFRGYLADLEVGRATVSGWKKGVTKQTLDPCSVTPANNATAALYTYTPWVGAYAAQCGTSQWGGSSLVALLYANFKSDAAWGSSSVATIIVDSNNARNDAALARSEVSANWTAATSTAGYYGTGYYYASVASVSDAADFWFYLSADATRTVDAWWTAGSNRSSATPFLAVNAAGVQVGSVTANQQLNGGRWNALGSFKFTRGWNRIRVSRWAGNGSVVIADAVRIR
ncbi:hypothetical protein FGE12_29400 [Aggregicoccus sp. 17bor-14]|uniref:golvesin C-terminal-like domain-containing protein n=1 Tax=Myxococcaceae TaxID=31 RepID=UPI00129C22DE|nr:MULTISPECIES: hypothetical protein [Myxococcaceae]MBF5046569.1 hypothetical protein [Simulacricoccus sp. 17bor-14]MRI92280.1 hypothetical protein [Aggregicoccus sp. 17bor-14]